MSEALIERLETEAKVMRDAGWSGIAATMTDAMVTLRKLRADAPQATEPGWQAISSAPKDGATVLVWRPQESPDYPAHVGIDFWKDNSWWRSRRYQQPTHWMPLPAQPKGALS